MDSNTYRKFRGPLHSVEWSDQFSVNRSLGAAWEAPLLGIFEYAGEAEKPYADFMSGYDVPAVSRRAGEIFKPLVGQTVEFLPLRTIIGEYFALHVRFLDCLDVAHSTVERSQDDGSVLWVDRYAFAWDRLVNVHMFRVAELGLTRLFVSGEFRNIYEANGMTGLHFHPVPIAG